MKIILSIILSWLTIGVAPSEPPMTTFVVDTQQSTVHWTGYYLFDFGEHNGSIRIRKGELSATGGELVSGNFEIDMTSLQDLDMKEDDGGKDLTEHLKSKDFFAVDEFPTAYFEITKVEKIAHNANQPNYEITGNMTLRGVKNVLKFRALVVTEKNILTAKAKFKFDRTKWNVQYNSGKFFSDVGDGAISDAIGIELNLQASLKP